ncbi:MAG: DUF4278 domain-containing protein [Phormidesmis sp.]
MELVYRGHRYQAKVIPATIRIFQFSGVYRGTPYQMIDKTPTQQSNPQEVQLVYRGVPYTRTL